ncbi:helix-turn-helix domain-containing protein [Rhizobium sp. SL86]|uniref:helix-turn-helix domain-containing protein n=1 Tax=Rhizobium sp. SL86 TaxID=2995148 RepID=UPI00227525AE|nr:helix-turn-helix domain-containing protein [Rhizobium sp. SL86]MCY1664598.1 helix-turn-helix domain-containing protein [Rhizobium sp. SL86]
MSIKVMSLVWSKAPVQGGELLLLLALADNANDHGAAFPSVPYLASKARMSDRNVQLCIRKLADSGFILIRPNAGPSGANKYVIDLRKLESLPDDYVPSRASAGGEKSSPPTNCHPVKSEAEGVKNDAPGGEAGFTQTIIEPSEEEPLSAHARTREAISEDHGASAEIPQFDRKASIRAFRKLINGWPNFAGMSPEKAEREWLDMSPEDQAAALAKRDPWIALLRKQGKDHTPAPSTYLRQRLWEAVPDVVEKAPDTVQAAPYGKLWTHHVLQALKEGPGQLPTPPAFIAKQIQAGTPIGKREAMQHQARHGWPKVNFMFHQAAEGKGTHVPAVEQATLPEMEAVMVDSVLYHEWQCAFSDRGWPWMKLPDAVRVVWFPKGGPSAHLGARTPSRVLPPDAGHAGRDASAGFLVNGV